MDNITETALHSMNETKGSSTEDDEATLEKMIEESLAQIDHETLTKVNEAFMKFVAEWENMSADSKQAFMEQLKEQMVAQAKIDAEADQ